ncbi:solute carrier family 22 member 13-like [Haemaphysalis longicornis]
MNLLHPVRRSTTGLIISESFDCNDAFGHGVFQLQMIVLVISAILALNCHALVMSVIARDIDHWCKQPRDSNVSSADWREQFIPVEADGRPSRCDVYKHINDGGEVDVIPCEEWEYGSGSETTVVSTWNLVCHRRVLLVAALAVQNTGSMVFAAIAGPLTDYIGRVPVTYAGLGLLLASTIGSCFVTSYVIHTVFRFFCAGSVLVLSLAIVTILFEMTTHDRRPLDVVFAGTISFVLSDVWVIITTPLELHWVMKHAIFLAPALIPVAAFFVVNESPRWLVAIGNLDEAEYVMLEGAKLNRFPLANTACLMGKLRELVNNTDHESIGHNEEGVLRECSLQRRLLIMIAAHFSLTFTLYTVIFSVPQDKAALRNVSFVALLLVYGLVHVLITRMPLVRVIRFCFLMLGGLQCLISAVLGFLPTVVSEGLAALSRAFATVGIFVSIVYVLELFPTAVRGTALSWTLAGGRVGAVCASVVFGLLKAGRGDVAFFLSGCAVFLSLLALRYLPRATGVECAKTEARQLSNQRQSLIDHMKRTLEPPDADRRASISSTQNTTRGASISSPQVSSP